MVTASSRWTNSFTAVATMTPFHARLTSSTRQSDPSGRPLTLQRILPPTLLWSPPLIQTVIITTISIIHQRRRFKQLHQRPSHQATTSTTTSTSSTSSTMSRSPPAHRPTLHRTIGHRTNTSSRTPRTHRILRRPVVSAPQPAARSAPRAVAEAAMRRAAAAAAVRAPQQNRRS